MDFEFPVAFQELFRDHRYKVFYGGRGSAKSWSFARALVLKGYSSKRRILCVREIQRSIAESVHKLLSDQIEDMGFGEFYDITKNSIVGGNGTDFIFKGIRFNTQEIKSTEGVDICWVAEAQALSAESWDVLIPTIRKANSEIWIDFNPLNIDDPTYQRFVINPPPDALVKKVNYYDNPYFPDVLRQEMDWTKKRDYEAYLHIWEGEVRKHSNAVIFAGRFRVEEFETDRDARFYQGCDWGFAQDPTALIRCYIKDRTLYIDREAWGVGVDLDETPALFDTIETARSWPIKADNARPETISFMKRRGFHISGAKKWAGSIEDGIEYLKSLDIVIHPRCRHTIDEFNHYSYKVDKQTGDVLPVVVDAWNHCLTGDTLIACADGEKPIKDIKAGEYVHTRQGLKKVIWSGETRHNAHVFSVIADGYKVTGTADHKIFTVNHGWLPIGHIQKGDILLCLRKPSKHTGKLGTDTRNQADDLTANITSAGQYGCTDTHGSESAAQFPQEWLSITKTETAKITQSKTLNAYQVNNIAQDTRWKGNGSKNKLRCLTESDRLRQLGMVAKRGENGTANTQRCNISENITESRASVNNAEKLLNRIRQETNFAQMLAKVHGDGRQELTTKKESARYAESLSPSINILPQNVVPVVVQCVLDGGTEKAVYDLTVEDAHEFFANGVLVHNCIDALRYSQDGLIKGRGQMQINPAALMMR